MGVPINNKSTTTEPPPQNGQQSKPPGGGGGLIHSTGNESSHRMLLLFNHVSSHGLTTAMIHQRETIYLNYALWWNREKGSRISQIVRAKENLKLSHGGPSYSQASGTNPPPWLKMFFFPKQRSLQCNITYKADTVSIRGDIGGLW